MKKLMMAAALAALACGCVTVNKNDGGDACLKPKICKDCNGSITTALTIFPL